MDDEEVLPSTRAGFVTRVGDTVRRPPPSKSVFVRRLLKLFEEAGWTGAPRFLGVDERGREILSYLHGTSPAYSDPLPGAVTDAGLIRATELVRQFHDLTAGTPLARGQETVCHGDLTPRNTVYEVCGDEATAVGFIDWDLAFPGPRVHDVASLCQFHLGVGVFQRDPDRAARQLRLITDVYGLEDRGSVIPLIKARLAAFMSGSDRYLEQTARSVHGWLADHADTLDRALS